MKHIALLPPLAVGLVLLLTYLLLQAATPDPVAHERILDTLRMLINNDAALERDVLRARAALLRNYDPLVQSVDGLREGPQTLRAAVWPVGRDAALDRQIDAIAETVRALEDLVDAFKSNNAVLQNSLAYFTHTNHRLAAGARNEPESIVAEARNAANEMLRLTIDPHGDAAPELSASLDRLAQAKADEAAQEDIRALVAHGRIVLTTLPDVDETIRRLLDAPLSGQTRALQDSYLGLHGQAAARAGTFRVLLYVASLALVLYLGLLFHRLQANARHLQSRLEFENLVAGISAQFINLPREHIDDGISDQLARLAEHAGVDRALMVIDGAIEPGSKGSYVWRKHAIDVTAGRVEGLLGVMSGWPIERYQRQGCVHVPDVGALPHGPERSCLEERGTRSWLCIPMWCAGKRVGFLTLESTTIEKHWPDDDIALLRTAGEIFANAIEREQFELERIRLETRLHQAQRLESIGTLAGGIAHEFNNILGAIFGYAEMASSALGRKSPAQRYVRQILGAGERAQSVINRILTFSRRSERQYGPVEAKPVVAGALELLRASLPATIAIESKLDVGEAMVLGDATELQQVVMNLGTNAAHAMYNHGTLVVALDEVEADGGVTLSHGSITAGRYVRLSVSDSGRGIEPAILDRILEPFFTTKAVGEGTGLGLSTVHGIVTHHGGALNIESRIGEGSIFQAYLPRTEASAAGAEPRSLEGDAVPRGHGETVLLVDNEKPLVVLGEEMLAALGYEPIGFDDSSVALRVFRTDPNRFDLVLTDEVMPAITGTELAKAMHQIRPELPIVLMTGYAGPAELRHLHTVGIREVLRKPLLSAAIAQCLARNLH